jgi:DMSO/TMAO reductase YedYZ molybdopterin-dependent catalytic subunit
MRIGPWRTALAAAIAELGAGELAAAVLRRAGSPVTGVGQTMIDLLPGPGVDMVVATAESKDKALLRAGVGGSTLGLTRVAAGLEAGRPGSGQRLLIGHGLLGGAAAAASPENASAPSLLAGLAGGLAGAGALARLRARRRKIAAERVTFAAGAFALGAAGALQRQRRMTANLRREQIALPTPTSRAPRPPANAELPIPGITPLFTPNRSFYVTDVAVSAPAIDPAAWRLRVHGLVERELELSLGQLLDMPLVEVDATLACVHNPAGGDRVGSARWLGLPLHALLERAGVRPGGDQILARSISGFTAGLPLRMAWEDPAPLVVLGMNGEPLPIQHGFPARLLTPGLWGADANPKWLTEIELTSWDRASDYWDARGWPRTPGRVKPGSRIDVPVDGSTLISGAALAAGVAWGPSSGVTGVELSIDGGEWRPATLSPSLSPILWRQWALTWRAEPGSHELRVRAICGQEAQSGDPAPPYPRGSSGYHTVRVTVVERGALSGSWRDRIVCERNALTRRAELAAMAPPAWRASGFPRRPTFEEAQPPAQRGMRVLLAGRTLARRAR